jgi:hypothetical protein
MGHIEIAQGKGVISVLVVSAGAAKSKTVRARKPM